MSSPEEQEHIFRTWPQEELESPFLAGELFVKESGGEWEARLAALESESPFQRAFEQDQTSRIEPEELAEAFDDEGYYSAGDGFLARETETENFARLEHSHYAEYRYKEAPPGIVAAEAESEQKESSGISSLAVASIKEWGAKSDRPKEWQGRVYGLVVHTTGGSLPNRAQKEGISPTAWGVRYYKNSRGCHYVNGWHGMDGRDLVQVANERFQAWGVGVTNKNEPSKDQRRSIDRGRFETDLPPILVALWRKRWPNYNHSLELLPNTRYANSCYIHVESPPCVYHGDKGLVTGAEPLRAGLRFTKAQHDTIAHLAVDIARRNGWPMDAAWWRTPRLLGHEDLTPIARHDKGGGWDPGYLREKPYFDWDYVYGKIEQILQRGTTGSAAAGQPLSGLFASLGSMAKKFRELIASGQERLAINLAIQQGQTDENKLTNLIFFARHPELNGRRLRPDEKELAQKWLQIRSQLVRPILQSRNGSELFVDELNQELSLEALQGETELAEGFVEELEEGVAEVTEGFFAEDWIESEEMAEGFIEEFELAMAELEAGPEDSLDDEWLELQEAQRFYGGDDEALNPKAQTLIIEQEEEDYQAEQLSEEFAGHREQEWEDFFEPDADKAETAVFSSESSFLGQDETSTGSQVVFPSGETLRILTGLGEDRDDEYWDPTRSGNPLLDTGPAHKDKKLSPNFTVRELTTSGGRSADIARIDPKLVECLQKLRDQVGRGVNITSGYRSWKRNQQVYAGRKNPDGTPKKPTRSQHCGGRAVDIKISGMNGFEIGKAAIDACGPDIGIGLGSNFAHIDMRGFAEAWDYGGAESSWIAAIKRIQKEKGGTLKRPAGPAAKPKTGSYSPAGPAPELVRFAQRVLNSAEGERLKVDGVLGKFTRGALERFHKKFGLGSGSMLDGPTRLALAQRALEEIAQQSLFANPGLLDANTEQVLKDFKSKRGLGFDATLDTATFEALAAALTQRGGSPRPLSPGQGLSSTDVKIKSGGWGGWKGRATIGTTRVSQNDIADKYDLAVAVAAEVETSGAFDKVQMYDRGILSWGIKQWTLHRGSLQKALAFIKSELIASGQNALWIQLFPGIDVQANQLVFNGSTYATPKRDGDAADLALRRLFKGYEDPKLFDQAKVNRWLELFALAARHPKIQKLQFEYAAADLKTNLNRPLGKVLRARRDVEASAVGNYLRIGDYIEGSPLAITLFNGMETQNPQWTYRYLKQIVDRMAQRNGRTYELSRWSRGWRDEFARELQQEFAASGVACWGTRALSQKDSCAGRTSRTAKILDAYRKLSR